MLKSQEQLEIKIRVFPNHQRGYSNNLSVSGSYRSETSIMKSSNNFDDSGISNFRMHLMNRGNITYSSISNSINEYEIISDEDFPFSHHLALQNK